jgi:hypothetical protein
MRDTRIEYKGKGFWIEELFIEVLSYYIATEFEKKSIVDYSLALQDVYEYLKMNHSGSSVGMVNILLDDSLKSQTDERDLIAVLEATKVTLAAKGEKIEIDELNAIEGQKVDAFKSPWSTMIYVSSLTGVLDIIIKMLKGE